MAKPRQPKKRGGSRTGSVLAHGVMDWMDDREVREVNHIAKIREAIFEHKGILSPRDTACAMSFMSQYYSKNMERLAKWEALQRELFSKLLLDDPDLPISKAEAISKGSELGKKRVYYERISAGYLEIVNSLKKIQEYHNQEAKNQY